MKIDVLSRAKKKFLGDLNFLGILKIDEMSVRSGKEKFIISYGLTKSYTSPRLA